mmetsp:Transcript_6610/g.13962  ORF Transcript_6610/g.13962 Transcript_6610/m.13962 type:complete len:319 (+) Transcript_6610:89-1045(+)
MSCAEFYNELIQKNPREISLRFGKEFEGRSPSNPVFGEFEQYIAEATNLRDLTVNWDNTCAREILKALLNGIARNKRCVLCEITVGDDTRPLSTIHKFDFVGLVSALGRRGTTIRMFRWGHNNYGESWWLTLHNQHGQKFGIDELVFPDARAYEATLTNLLEQVAGDGVQDLQLYLCRFAKHLSFDGLKRIFTILSTKVTSLTSFALKLTPQDNEYCREVEIWQGSEQFPYTMIILALADMVKNCPELERIQVDLGSLSQDNKAASKKLADAITGSKSLRMKKNVKLYCWSAEYVPWGSASYKTWVSDDESEVEDGDY